MTTATNNEIKMSRWQFKGMDRVYINFPRDRRESTEVSQIKVWAEKGGNGMIVIRTKAPCAERYIATALEVREELAFEAVSDATNDSMKWADLLASL